MRAQRLVELDGDLVALLQSRVKESGGGVGSPGHTWDETDDVRQRKLDRMAAVRRQEGVDGEVKTKIMVRSTTKALAFLTENPAYLLKLYIHIPITSCTIQMYN